jgi:hypothetical protein
MITILKETLAKRLQIDPQNLLIVPITRPLIQTNPSIKENFLLTILPEKSQHILLTNKLEKETEWKFKDFILSLEILRTLKLKYSLSPSESEYFRITYNDTAYDVVMMKKANGRILNEYFEMFAANPQDPHTYSNLTKALKAFAKALAELHLAKLRHHSAPGKPYESSKNHWTNCFLEFFPLWNLSLPLESYRSFLNKLDQDCRQSDFLTGIIHYDPTPQNIVWNEETNQITLIDIESIAMSLDSNGNSVGPIAWDYTNASQKIANRILFHQLPQSIAPIFSDAYRVYMKGNFPSKSQILYYSCLQSMKTLLKLSQILKPDAYRQAMWQKEARNIETIITLQSAEQ